MLSVQPGVHGVLKKGKIIFCIIRLNFWFSITAERAVTHFAIRALASIPAYRNSELRNRFAFVWLVTKKSSKF